MFEDLWTLKHVVPFQSSVSDMLCILQDMIDMGGAFSTNKIDLADSFACQIGFGRDWKSAPTGARWNWHELTVTEDHFAFGLIQS